jgi:methyl-accepting chemotaxis protein
VFKELDYATNLNNGKWKDTDLGNVYRAAMKDAKPGGISFFDFRPYAPSADAPASFIGTPLVDLTGKIQGALVFQMPVDEMNGLMQEKAGLGKTGQTYIVGRDHLMRSQGRFTEKPTILSRKIETQQVDDALAGMVGAGDAVNERGQSTRVAYKHTDFHGSRWAFIAERTQKEISEPIVELRNDVIMVSALAFFFLAIGGMIFARSLARPMGRLTIAMQKLADGDKEANIPGTDRRDEIGDMARTAGVFKNSMIETENLQAEQREVEKRAQEEENRRAEEKRTVEASAEEEKRAADKQAEAVRKEAMIGMADGFEKSVMSLVESLNSAATEMKSSAQSMSTSADQTNQQATAVAAASEEATVNVQTVASSAEELSASIEEISRQVAQSNQIAQNAVDEAKMTNEKVEGLAQAAQKIGEVVSLINDIASQTNLLALNATIEAARAGDAGKGFAVVASEVKSLATQTGKATEEIGAQITAIQGATGEAVGAIQGIGSTIGQLGEIATSVASAVEEQGSATREIASSVQQAAAGTQEVSGNIVQVTQAASETQASSGQMLSAANELAQQGEVLWSEVDKFLQEVRAA